MRRIPLALTSIQTVQRSVRRTDALLPNFLPPIPHCHDGRCLTRLLTRRADETGGGGGVILFFPSAYQHIMFNPGNAASKNNNGLVDVRFATARHVLDEVSYPPTRDGRAPFVPLGVNSCPMLTLAPRTWPSHMAGDAPRFDWCCTIITVAHLTFRPYSAGTCL